MHDMDHGANAKRVAVVDNDPFMLRALGSTLMMSGYRILLYNHPWAAMTELAEADVDIVILDRHMPLCSGPDLARRLRRRWGKKTPPLVLLGSSLADLPDEERALFDLVVEKPIRPGDLMAELSRLLRPRPVSGFQPRAGVEPPARVEEA